MKKKIVIAVILIILLLICYLFFANLNNSKPLSGKEKEAALTKTLGRALQRGTARKKDINFKGKYMVFTYPGNSVVYGYRQPGFKNDKATLEYFSFDLKNPRLIFNYSVIDTLNLMDISDYPSVRIRETDPAYDRSDYILDGKKGILLTKKSGEAEEVVFILDKRKLYTIIVVGQSFTSVDDLFRKVVKSAKFL